MPSSPTSIRSLAFLHPDRCSGNRWRRHRSDFSFSTGTMASSHLGSKMMMAPLETSMDTITIQLSSARPLESLLLAWQESETMDPQTAALLLLPLLAYKISAMMNGQKLLWYLDAAIVLAVTSFLVRIFQS